MTKSYGKYKVMDGEKNDKRVKIDTSEQLYLNVNSETWEEKEKVNCTLLYHHVIIARYGGCSFGRVVPRAYI